uniref:Uncharacterized protein n=1 Tax=Terrapene triunguis TaxID=2587831 RepID=A0A674I1F4_9SAUR
MEAVEQYPSAPRPGLSFEELNPAGRQRPRSRLSPSWLHSKHRASSLDDVLVEELDMLLDAAATVIQAAWRGYQARQQLCAQYHAAVAIQAVWRGYLARERLASQRVEAAAQQGYAARREHVWAEPALEEEQAAVVIQAHYRGYRVRCEIYNQNLAATIIQAHYRGYRTRQALAESHRAATTIQAHYRGYRTRQKLAHARAAERDASCYLTHLVPGNQWQKNPGLQISLQRLHPLSPCTLLTPLPEPELGCRSPDVPPHPPPRAGGRTQESCAGKCHSHT